MRRRRGINWRESRRRSLEQSTTGRSKPNWGTGLLLAVLAGAAVGLAAGIQMSRPAPAQFTPKPSNLLLPPEPSMFPLEEFLTDRMRREPPAPTSHTTGTTLGLYQVQEPPKGRPRRPVDKARETSKSLAQAIRLGGGEEVQRLLEAAKNWHGDA